MHFRTCTGCVRTVSCHDAVRDYTLEQRLRSRASLHSGALRKFSASMSSLICFTAHTACALGGPQQQQSDLKARPQTTPVAELKGA